jgi:hypothetical protein
MTNHDYLSGCVPNTGNEGYGDVRNITIKDAQQQAVSVISMIIINNITEYNRLTIDYNRL